MTNKQTIDGVSRELLEQALLDANRVRFDTDKQVIELRALLDAQANRCGNCGSETVQACNDRGCFFFESGNGEPAAQSQGELERLREELSLVKNEDLKYRSLLEQEGEIKALRTQRAALDALLRRAQSFVESWDDDSQEWMDLSSDISNTLSTSAEPKP